MQKALVSSLSEKLPSILRWAGSLARELRNHNIAVTGKTSGSALTDALTLADLTLQDLIVNAMRDLDPIFLKCRIEAEESTGDLERFARESEYVISLDPIDGTKQFRDKTGDGYAVMLHLRTDADVIYSLVYLPARGSQGSWVEVKNAEVRVGEDDWNQPAETVLQQMSPIDMNSRPDNPEIYLIGFQDEDAAKAEEVTKTGLKGVAPDDMPGSIYPLLGTGEFGGSLIHTPNVYDFPVALHIARVLGGDSIWVHNQKPVRFEDFWMDDRADMLRLHGIVATSANPETLKTLAKLAQDWNQTRYRD